MTGPPHAPQSSPVRAHTTHARASLVASSVFKAALSVNGFSVAVMRAPCRRARRGQARFLKIGLYNAARFGLGAVVAGDAETDISTLSWSARHALRLINCPSSASPGAGLFLARQPK